MLRSGRFLWGFGAAIAVLLGLFAGFPISQAIGAAWTGVDRWLSVSGASAATRIWFTGLVLGVAWFLLCTLPFHGRLFRGVASDLSLLRSGTGNWRTLYRIAGAMVVYMSLYLVETVRPASPALVSFYGEGGRPWVGLFRGTPREWWVWVALAATLLWLIVLNRSHKRVRSGSPS